MQTMQTSDLSVFDLVSAAFSAFKGASCRQSGDEKEGPPTGATHRLEWPFVSSDSASLKV